MTHYSDGRLHQAAGGRRRDKASKTQYWITRLHCLEENSLSVRLRRTQACISDILQCRAELLLMVGPWQGHRCYVKAIIKDVACWPASLQQACACVSRWAVRALQCQPCHVDTQFSEQGVLLPFSLVVRRLPAQRHDVQGNQRGSLVGHASYVCGRYDAFMPLRMQHCSICAITI